jgi:O-antigen/teichoic acid export membrane protein
VEEDISGNLSRFGVVTGFLRRQFHHGRGGRAKLAISTSLFARLITTSVSFVVLPFTVRYLGNEGYGLLTTITSVVGWLQFTNMGIGLGLQNALTDETGKANRDGQRELISTAVFFLIAIGVILLATGLLVFPYIAWTRVFPPTTGRFATEIPWTVLTVFFGFVSTVMLGFVGPIYAARQELHLGSIQSVIASLLTLVGTFAAIHFRLGLLGLTICTIGITTVVQWSFALWTLYGRGIGELCPSWRRVALPAATRIYKNGLSFLMLQICNVAFFQIDAFLIVRFLTVDQVTPYSVAQRVFLQASGLFAIVTGSLWAAYGNAKAQGDFAWIRRTHAKMRRIFVIFYAGLTTGMISLGQKALALWVGPAAAPGTLLIAGVALYFCVREWTALHAMLLNGLNIVTPQVWNLMLTGVLTVILDLFFITRLGPLGLAVGGFIAFTSASAWYLPYLTVKALRPVDPRHGHQVVSGVA